MKALHFLNPVRVLKNLFIGFVLCRRYNISFDPFYTLEKGGLAIGKSIHVNPFSLHFNSLFFHELGHEIHHKLVDYSTYFIPTSDTFMINTINGNVVKDFEKVLKAEMFASRFALKTKKADQKFLIKCFNTYTKLVFNKNGHIKEPAIIPIYTKIIHEHYLKLANF